jgi:guanine deaminase
VQIVRADVMHTPRDPFREEGALEAFDDGAVAFEDGRILATGSFAQLRREHPEAPVLDHSGAILLPGLVDTHVHYPQLGVVGAMGLELLEWLELRALPAEARLADPDHARSAARDFVRGLAAAGTTTALEHLLYLATRAGADALGLGDSVGDLSAGKSADFVLVRPTAGGTLDAVLRHVDSPEGALGAVFTLAREESVAEVRVAGEPV